MYEEDVEKNEERNNFSNFSHRPPRYFIVFVFPSDFLSCLLFLNDLLTRNTWKVVDEQENEEEEDKDKNKVDHASKVQW